MRGGFIGPFLFTACSHTGAKLQDMFSESQQGATCSFKEPPELGGQFRWQIIHIKEKDTMNMSIASGEDNTTVDQKGV